MKKILLYSLVLFFLGLLSQLANSDAPPVGLPAQTPDHLAGEWYTETVDVGTVGYYNSLAIDSHNFAHIAYYDKALGNLKYAHQTASGWQIETVDEAGDVGGFASLALDPLDRPHIAYCRFSITPPLRCLDLLYSWYDGTTWQHLPLDQSADDVGEYASLALNNFAPHVSYYDRTHGDLKYAFWDTASMTPSIETVDSAGDAGFYSSLRVWDDQPHIAYYAAGDLKYAWKNSSGVWNYETVATVGSVGHFPSLRNCWKLGSWETYITYYDASLLKLMLAHRGLLTWEFSEIASDFVYNPPSFQIHSSCSSLEVSYFEGYSPTHLRYLVRTIPSGSTTWDSQNVDTVSDSGYWMTSLALDRDLRPHISYFYLDDLSLRYASKYFNSYLPMVQKSP